MLRTTLARLLALALLAPAGLLAAAATPAQAAAGDVLSMQWQTVSYRAPVVSEAATFTPYATGLYANGANAVVPGTFNGVWLAPPTGERFVAGTTYEAAHSRAAGRALLSFYNAAFSRSECSSTSTAPYTGSVTVHSAAYDDSGTLTDLAADYTATCRPATGASETLAGSVRHVGAEPWLAVVPTAPKDTVATGRERTTSVTLSGTGSGKTVHLGPATLSGDRAADYRIGDDGCTGADLGPADSCTVKVVFAPQASASAAPDRVARLSVPAAGHVLSTVEVGLASRAVTAPGAPVVKPFPTADGLGLVWDGPEQADSFRVERGSEASGWTTLQEVAAGEPLRYVDTTLAPGAAATYRVTGSISGWPGAPATVEGVRPATVPAVGPSSTVSYGGDDASTPWRTVSSTTAARFEAYGGTTASLYADEGAASLTWRLPVVPGPGEYVDASAGEASLGSAVCPQAQRVLEVRSVLYDETARPLVLDGSWVERCGGTSAPRRMEVRLGTGGPGGRVTTTPTTVGPLTGFGESTATARVELGNGGSGPVTFGPPTIDGDGAADWSVQDSTCTAPVLAGGSCALTVRFATTTQGDRPATLTLKRSDEVGALAPVYVSLSGTGGTAPGAVGEGSTLGTVGAVVVWWGAADGHGIDVDDYHVQRQEVGTSSWESVGSTAGDRMYVDRTADPDVSYRYRVSARNVLGYGPETVVGGAVSPGAERGLVVAGARSTTGATALYQVVPDRPDAPAARLTTDGRDYFSPALSPAGSRLAFSRSVTSGTDGEYDLWTGTLAEPLQRRLTSMSGMETDAAYSPDASSIAFTRYDAQGHSSVWVVDALGGTPRRLRLDVSAPAWTADGRSLVVQDDSSEQAPLLTLDPSPTSTTAATPVLGTEGGYEPAIARSGRLAWISGDGRALALDPGTTTPVVALEPRADSFLAGLAFDDLGTLHYDVISTTTFEPISRHTDALAVSFGPAPLRSDRRAPELGVDGPGAYVGGSAEVTVRASDHDETPTPVLRPHCVLDAQVLDTCGGTTPLLGLSEGAHVLRVEVSDESGHSTAVERSFVSDSVAPTLSLTAPTQTSVNLGSGAFAWSGSDRASGVAAYEVRTSTATPWSAATAYVVPSGLGSTTAARGLTVRPALGQTVCLRVRARDRAGLWSAYQTRCVSRPLDDRSLRGSAGWRRTTLHGGLQGTATTVARTGASLSTASTATVRRIGVQAVTCSSCGAVRVYVGSTYAGLLNLRGAAATRLVYLPTLSRTLRGVVTLRTTSTRRVTVDGLVLAPS